MLPSLYTAVSGLDAQQRDLDVIANNVANATTVGFKSSRVDFADLYNQLLAGATAPQTQAPTFGGVNPQSVGTGVTIAAIDTDMNQGQVQTTGMPTDLMINGNGFFVVGRDTGAGPTYAYTRAGDFHLDANGNLVTSDGLFVYGYDPNGPATGAPTYPIAIPSVWVAKNPPNPNEPANGAQLESWSIGQNGTVTAVYNGTTYSLGQLALATFNNPGGLQKSDNTRFVASANAGVPLYGTPDAPGFGQVLQNRLELSNVNLGRELSNMLVAQSAYQANARVLSTDNTILQTLVTLGR
ncbi:MAG: flagellar hook-basal body complex protein [Firmicutes bacterium]|nr:flagellar hook-basal body complex protein [Bacillota bacterium]